jgi:hypothetical protein
VVTIWIFTTEGFYSAVEETKLKRHIGQISVRAREPGALELLRERYMPGLSDTSVTPRGVTADYRYRAWVDRDQFAEGMANVARAVDYDNFKSAAGAKRGFGRFEKALHEVWSVMSRLQPGGPYGHGGKQYPPIPEGEPGAAKKGGRKKAQGQARLPLAFTGGECQDCGHELEPGDGEWFQGRWLCRDVAACSDRKWQGRAGAAKR